MPEDIYAVTFEDTGRTYVTAAFYARNEAETCAERLEEERYEELLGKGEIEKASDYVDLYGVEELDPEILGEEDLRLLEEGDIAIPLD